MIRESFSEVLLRIGSEIQKDNFACINLEAEGNRNIMAEESL